MGRLLCHHCHPPHSLQETVLESLHFIPKPLSFGHDVLFEEAWWLAQVEGFLRGFVTILEDPLLEVSESSHRRILVEYVRVCRHVDECRHRHNVEKDTKLAVPALVAITFDHVHLVAVFGVKPLVSW